MGPIPVGINKFVLTADPPDISRIPEGDILGVTVVLVTCSYREKEFVRVGYYVNNEYTEQYDEEAGPPKPLDMNKVRRSVLAEKPRVTRFPICWGDKEEEEENNNVMDESEQGQSVEHQMMGEVKIMRIIANGEEDMIMEDAIMGDGIVSAVME